MPGTAAQFQLSAPKGQFTQVAVPRPIPGPYEICIHTKAVALNPLDAKQYAHGILVQSWPAVLGVDASGIVESVGESVQDFQPGDEVFGFCGMGNRSAAFQEVIAVNSRYMAKKPENLSFEEAASLPICHITAAAAIAVGLQVPLPHLNPTQEQSHNLNTILVLGGSSAVGAAAIQLLRLALPAATILTTSSKQHHPHLISLGATHCFERSAHENPSIIQAATPNSGVDAILEAVGAAAHQPAVFGALDPAGPKLYSEVDTGVRVTGVTVPDGVNGIVVSGHHILGIPGGKEVMSALAGLVEAGRYELPVRVEVVGRGFGAIRTGLGMLEGVSGTKLVVSL